MFLHTSLKIRGVTSVLTYYLTAFGQPLLSTEFVVFVFLLFCFLFSLSYSFFIFLMQNLFEDFGYYLSHWYHLSLSVIIIYHKVFHISISFLYKFTYIVFMQKVETLEITLKPLTILFKICYNGYVRRSL